MKVNLPGTKTTEHEVDAEEDLHIKMMKSCKSVGNDVENENNNSNNNNIHNNNHDRKDCEASDKKIDKCTNKNDTNQKIVKQCSETHKSSIEHSVVTKAATLDTTNPALPPSRRTSKRGQVSSSNGNNIREECFNITHHFIECEKLSIRTITETDESSIMHKSVWSGYDPLLNMQLRETDASNAKEKTNNMDKQIKLAAPFQSEFKVIFCGDSGVGKTSLICRICFNDFCDDENMKFTTQVDTYLKNVVTSGQNFRLKLWDTVGQERYNSVPHSYYRKCDVAIVMYDICRQESFDNLHRWLETVLSCCEDILVIIIGSKSDICHARTVTRQKAELLAKENGAVYLETSSKTGENVERLLYLITTKLVEKNEFVMIQNYFEQSYVTSSPTKRSCCKT